MWGLALLLFVANSLATTVPIPSMPRVTKNPTRLNNFVVEILKVHGKDAKGIRSIKHFQPVDGWVYVAAEAKANDAERILLWWDNDSDARRALKAPGEKQAWLEAGEHVLRVDRAGAADLDALVIRRVAETSFSKFGATPQVLAMGDYDWDWMSAHVLPHVNTVAGYNEASQLSYARQWKSRGGRWLAEVSRPARPADLLAAFGATSPFVDGLNVDEFGPGLRSLPLWTRELPALGEKEFRAYIAERPEEIPEFIGAVQRSGGKLIWERYIGEIPPEMDGGARLERDLGNWAMDLTNRFPGIMRQSVICLGIFSAPPVTLNRSPEIDFKVWLDMQFQQVATNPVFQGLPGIMVYQTRYADEETVRWSGALFRHYAIEGNRNLLSERFGFGYRQEHLANADFRNGLEGWLASGKARAATITNLARWQGRYPAHEYFDRALILEKGGAVTQRLRNLENGKLYSAKMISARVRDLQAGRSEPELHGVKLEVTGAKVLAEKSFGQPVAGRGRFRAPFSDENILWLEYHQVVFRGEREAAVTILADGEQAAVNFIEVQGYFSE